jgi:hypothetical protein
MAAQTTTSDSLAAHGHEASMDVDEVLAVLDGELEDIWLDEWTMPEGIGYRYDRNGDIDPHGAYTTAQLLRLGAPLDLDALETARFHLDLDLEDQAALAWLAYLTPDGQVPAELLDQARHTPTCKLLDCHRDGLDWLADQAPASYLVFASGQPGNARPALRSILAGLLAAVIEARETRRRAWAGEHRTRLLEVAVAVVALRQRAERHGELHLADPAFRGMVAQVRAQLRAVGRGGLAGWLPDAEIGRALVRGEFFCDARLQDGGHANAWDWWDPPAGVCVSEDSPESERQAYAVHWARAELAHRYAGP